MKKTIDPIMKDGVEVKPLTLQTVIESIMKKNKKEEKQK